MKQIINIPNVISIFRILLIPVFVWTYFEDYIYAAAGVLLLSGLTDTLDGIIARKFHMITELGKILDPIADKLTQVTVAVCVAVQNWLTNPILVVLIAICILKEVIMSIGSLVLMKNGQKPAAAKWFGKLATVVFYAAMVLIIWLNIEWLNTVLLLIVTAFMIFALINYFKVFQEIKKQNEKGQSDLPQI